MKDLRDRIIDVEILIIAGIDRMLYESKFAPAAHGVNIWRSARDFALKVSPFNGEIHSLINEYPVAIMQHVIRDRFAVDLNQIGQDEVLVLEVGDKNQIEVKRGAFTATHFVYRIIPSGV